jgi:hypothetical protein
LGLADGHQTTARRQSLPEIRDVILDIHAYFCPLDPSKLKQKYGDPGNLA